MSDLISRSDLLKEIREGDKVASFNYFIALVQGQPTAYDVERVVKKIKKRTCKKCRNILGPKNAEKYCKEVNCEIEAVCEIVRRGGVDERA